MTPLELRDLIEGLGRQEAFAELLAAVRRRDPALYRLSGLVPTARAAYALLLQKISGRPALVLTGTQAAAESLHETLQAWFDMAGYSDTEPAPCLLPAQDVMPFDGLSPHPEISEGRATALCRMAAGRASIVIAPVAAALQRVAGPESYRGLERLVEAGDEIRLEELEQGLDALGYSRRQTVEMVGQFAVRGGIVDIFVPERENPFRLELFGDRVESVREFSSSTQKSIRRLPAVTLLPLQEIPAGGSGAGLLAPGWEFEAAGPQWRSGTVLGLLPDAVLQWHEPQEAAREAESLWEELLAGASRSGGDPAAHYMDLDDFGREARGRMQVAFDQLGLGAPHLAEPDAAWSLPSQSPTPFQGNVAHCVQEIKARVADGWRVLVAASSAGDLERLADMLGEYEAPFQVVLRDRSVGLSRFLEERAAVSGPAASAILAQAPIAHGCTLPASALAVLGTQDVFASSDLVPKPSKRQAVREAFLSDIEDLREGDWVVHAQHGVARYRGVVTAEAAGRSDDFMLLEYAESAKLYLPLERVDLLHKYHGAGGPEPTPDRLGGQSWERTKRRVKARLLEMADDLLKLYAKRSLGRDFAYSIDSAWQREFEESFAHEPTADQLTAAAEIKRDMESRSLMDRLVCGDVGFGKTEVAMRAAFKALADDKQVAVLAPTTVLAFQHWETFRQRFAAFPVEIEMLSRFRTPAERRAVREGMLEGRVDIVVGTHMLLAEGLEFRDLGLLVVDEEQRFGVRHKERLKQLRKNLDVLALTATPIPRTLYMSLMGLRDVSIINTPPQNRLAVQTVVAAYEERLVLTAIEREVARGGQVYFLHNRVETVEDVTGRLAAALPGVRFRAGHGRMPERLLEDVMLGFVRHEFDVLVATTIVENGLDIPLANTLIVDRADLYGLAQLYQLRGRVGRSDRRAYAYLLVPPGRELNEQARKRLAALKEFSELGAGFKVAARDLELRGAGNLLGGEQSGQVAAVGFETYTQLLDEAVRKLRGEDVEEAVRTQIRLHVDVHIPTEYVPEEAQRLKLYRELSAVRDAAGRDAALADLRDRYGPPPETVANLLEHAILRHRAEALRVSRLELRANRLVAQFRPDSKIDPGKLADFVAATDGASFTPEGALQWSGFDPQGRAVFERLSGLLETLVADGSQAASGGGLPLQSDQGRADGLTA